MSISVVIPALNEEDTIEAVIAAAAADEPEEIIVVDADSTDATAGRARRAGADVRNWKEILPHIVPIPGKGESLWRGVAAARGEVVVFLDADLIEPHPGIVKTLAEPLLDPQIHLVKANYRRTLNGAATGGGRVTELCARPLLSLYFPELSDIAQPLAGEYAIRATTARSLPFVADYGVESGLLIDTYRAFGRAAITQRDLPARKHKNKALAELRPMATTVAATIAARFGAIDTAHPEFPGQRPALETII